MINLKDKKTLVAGLLLAAVFLFWEIACYFKLVDIFLFPAPSKILKTAWILLKEGELQKQSLITLKRFFLGLSLGVFAGLVVSLLYGLFRKANKLIELFLYFTYPVPRFALLPFILIFFGTGINSKVIFIGLGAFYPCVINAISGINQIDKNYLEIARHYGAQGWKLYQRVILPGSLPSIFTGFHLAIGLALTYTILVEFLTATDGIGAMMWLSLQTLRMDKLFLGAIMISLINILLTSFLLKSAEKFFIKWNK